MSRLFSTIQLRDLIIRNRTIMAPMCIYLADDTGRTNDNHLVYYGARALGGIGLIIFEATSISPEGRNSVCDLGVWEDNQIEGLKRIIGFCKENGAAVCVQLAHAGRKAWADDYGVGPQKPIGPSAVPQGKKWVVPYEMNQQDIQKMTNTFQEAAKRIIKAGADCIEIHAAHGYLLHQFLSPVANKRKDKYGGSMNNRMRFLIEVTEAVREIIPQGMPLLARLSVVDYAPDGLTLEDSIEIAKTLKSLGVDLVDCSSGGILEDKPVRLGPGYQVPFSEGVKNGAKVMTAAVGSISAAQQAEEILLNERADMVALGRELLHNPHWAFDAAHILGDEITWPKMFAPGRSSLGCH